MKILLLCDNSGAELQLFKSGEGELTLELNDPLKSKISFTLNDEDREYLICELARLRDIKQ